MGDKMFVATCGNNLKLHKHPNYELATTSTYNTSAENVQLRNMTWCNDGSWIAVVPYHGYVEIVGCNYERDGNANQSDNKFDWRFLQTVTGVKLATAASFQHTVRQNIALSSVNGSVLLYDVKQSKIKKQFAYSGSTVTYLDWNITDTNLAAGSIDGNITLYSTASLNHKCIFTVPESKSVSALRFHPIINNYLACASDEGVVAVWDIQAEKHTMYMKTHIAPVSDVVFSTQRHSLLISVALDRTYRCYDTNTNEFVVSVITDHPLSTIDMAPDGFYILIGTTKGSIFLYDLRRYTTPVTNIQAHTSEVKKILFKPNVSVQQPQSKISEGQRVQKETSNELLIGNQRVQLMENVQPIEDSSPYVNESNILNNLQKDSEQCTSNIVSLLTETDEPVDKKPVTETPINENNLTNLGLTDSFKRLVDIKYETPEDQITNTINNLKMSSGDAPLPSPTQLHQPSVLPKSDMFCLAESPESSLASASPRVFNNSPEPVINETFEERIRQIVLEVFEEKISDLTENIDRNFLNLQMCFIKQMVSQEKYFENLFNEALNNNGVNSSYVKQVNELRKENEYLKSKINELLEKN